MLARSNTQRVRKNISLGEEEYKKINTYVKMHDKTFSGFLCELALEKIAQEEQMSLNEYLQKNCEKVSLQEQKEIDALGLDFDDISGKELKLSDVL